MPHIHTEPGQADFAVEVFIVHMPTRRLLLRFHDKLHMWLSVGGHIELDETPEEAAVREVAEEVGLAVALHSERRPFEHKTERYEELIPPHFLCAQWITPEHRHITLVYFASADSDAVCEPEGREKSGGCLWLTEEELLAHPDVHETIKHYGQAALRTLVPERG